MKFGAILAGLIFLFNPNVNLIDVLPDAIGWGLIFYGLWPLNRTSHKFGEASVYAGRLFLLSLIKIPAFFLCIGLNAGDPLLLLIAALVFGALEIVFGLPFAFRFFDGIPTPAETAGSVRAARRMTILFFIAKPVLCVLPDLTLLASDQYGIIGADGVQTMARFRGPFTVAAVLIVLLLGIIWLALILPSVRRMKKDKAFLSELDEIAAAAADPVRDAFRRLVSALSLAFFGSIFLLELKIEGYSLIPPMIAAFLFFAFFFLEKKTLVDAEGKGAKPIVKYGGMIAAGAWFVLSSLTFGLQLYFTETYYSDVADAGLGYAETIEALLSRSTDFAMSDTLTAITVCSVLASTAFFLTLLCFCRAAKKLIPTYTGLPADRLSEREKSEAILAHEAAELAAIRTPLFARLKVLLVFGALTALVSAVFPLVEVYVPLFFTVDLILRVLFVVLFSLYLSRFGKAVRDCSGMYDS